MSHAINVNPNIGLRRHRRWWIWACVIGAVFATSLLAYTVLWRSPTELRRGAATTEDQTTQNLKQLFFAVEEYANLNNDKLPASLEVALKFSAAPSSIFAHRQGEGTERLEYIYIDWSPLPLSQIRQQEYPVIYDDRLNWHAHRGILILMSNGSVRWDVDGKWLKHFAETHREIAIRLPTE